MRPDLLVSTEWLEAHLMDPSLRIVDCTAERAFDADGYYSASEGCDTFESGHIAGAVHLDLVRRLADPESPLRFTLPTPERFADAVSEAGISNDSQVVLYSRMFTWTTRLWWMFRVFGFDHAKVLDGGWPSWEQEGRPTATGKTTPRAKGDFVATFRPELVAGKQTVLDALGRPGTVVVDSLLPEQYAGTGRNVHFAPKGTPDRVGHIAGSVNVAANLLADPATQRFLPLDTIRERFEELGIGKDTRVITYCGAGIAATGNAFALALLGRDGVAVYNNSLQEWACDPALPMEQGEGQPPASR